MSFRGFYPATFPGDPIAYATTLSGDDGETPIVVSTFHGGKNLYIGPARIRVLQGLRGGDSFSPSAPEESEWFTFDFADLLNDLFGGIEIIQTATWTVTVDKGVDASAATRAVGNKQINGSRVSQWIVELVEGVTYIFRCVAITDSGQRLELFGKCFCDVGSIGSFLPSITPSEVEWFGFDYMDIECPVIGGTFSVSVKIDTGGADPAPEQLLEGVPLIRGSQVWQLINAITAVPGNTYTLLCLGNTGDGQVIALRRAIKIKAE